MKPVNVHSRVIRSGASALCVIASFAVDAAEPAPADGALTRPDVEQIMRSNAAARGGLEAWRAITTVTENGRIEHGQLKGPRARHGTAQGSPHALDQSLPFTLQFKRPHKMRLEMDLGDMRALQVFDGIRGWTLQPSPNGPRVRAYSAGEAAAAADQVDPEGPLLDATANGTRVALDGEDTVEGHRAFKLSLTLKSGAERHVWVDAQTYLDLKVDGSRVIDGKPWPAETYFYDWKQVGQVKLPCRIETEVNQVRTTSRILVDRVLIDAPVDDSVFSLPAPTERK